MSLYINPKNISRDSSSTQASTAHIAVTTAEAMVADQLLAQNVTENLADLYQRFSEILTSTTGKQKPEPARNWSKYWVDCLLIFFATPALIILFALIALLLKLESSASLFDRHRVLGLGGHTFDAFKFRTVNGSGQQSVTGSLLQQAGLSELPLVINVLKGQMSLVGPRPITPEEAKYYGEYSDEILSVVPGLTGLWQVSGNSTHSMQDRILLDIQYVRQQTLRLDLSILFQHTLRAVINKE